MKKLLAVASGGGHWVQLQRLRPAFEGLDVCYLTTDEGYRNHVAGARFRTVHDASRWNKLALLLQALRVLWVVARERPDFVLSTGAAVGYFALRFGKLLGARTVWIDSIANAEELSLSGQKAGACADLWLTQWEHLAREGGPRFAGAVL